jgi:GC-rich sequence DNA-binding factor
MLDSEGLSQLTREKYGVLDSVSTSTSAGMWPFFALPSRSRLELILPTYLDDPTPNIPSSAQITAAKARRTKLRANPASEDFIALDGLPGTLKILDPHDSSSFSGPHPDSRLVREEDELGDGDDDHAEFTGANERMPLGKKANREAARRMKEGIVDMIEEVQDDDESDEEAREWEEAQIRRASRWKEEEKEKVHRLLCFVLLSFLVVM